MNARKLSKLRASQARSLSDQRQITAIQTRDRAQTFRADYQGYDADSGLHRAETADGGVIYSTAVTNAGIATGDRVSVSRSHGARYGAIAQCH